MPQFLHKERRFFRGPVVGSWQFDFMECTSFYGMHINGMSGLQRPPAYATMRSTTMRSDVTNETRLGSLERLVMEYVWSNPGCTAEECRQATSAQRSLRESTIRTVLTRLEQKRLVTHQEDGRSYRYRATAPKGSFAARAVNRIIKEFCGGSVEKLLVGMVDSSLVDRKTLEKVARTVDHRSLRK